MHAIIKLNDIWKLTLLGLKASSVASIVMLMVHYRYVSCVMLMFDCGRQAC